MFLKIKAQVQKKKEKNNRPNSLKSGTTFINPKKILPGQNVYQNEAGLKEKQWIRPLSRRIEMVENPENNLIKSFPRPELWILKSRNSGNPFLRFYLDDLDYSLIVDGLVPVRNDVKNESVDFKWKPGLNISLQVLNTFQFYQSELTDHAVRVANRNYPALMESGKMLGVAVNYGISVEKQFLNHWGLSAGFQKLNFNQIQETNYWLKEAPVINMNGEIAGYIAITPEHIHTLVENRLEYISMPVRLNYAVRLSPTGEIQFSAGSGLLGLLSQQLQKFDYRTLELKPYVNNAGRLTVNNILSGIHFSKDIGKQWAISAGYEWQKFFQIPQLSDPLEEIKSNNHNLTISLKYQYK